MKAILTCIVVEHDLRLVALAAVICLLSVASTLAAYRRSHGAVEPYRGAWLVTAAVLGGMGVWSTHFLGMLAYRPGPMIGFELWLTLASLLIAIAGFALGYGMHVAAKRNVTRGAAGLIFGGAIAAMHFTGMGALDIHAKLTWRYDLVAVAVICSLGFGAAAMIATRERSGTGRKVAAAGLFTLAILSLHFIGMSAMVLSPALLTHAEHKVVDHHQLALLVTAIDALILSVAAAVMLMEQVGFRATLASLSEALDSAPSAIAFFDSTGKMVFWNSGFGEALDVVEIKPSRSVTFTQIREALLNAPWLQAQFTTGGAPAPRPLLEALQTPDGRWLQLATGRTRGGGIIVVVNDITTERTAREMADQANRSKSDFLANVSHEIRTPLNGVLGMAQVMAVHPLAPEQRERLDTIRASSEGLLSVLNSVLDMAKIEAGRMEIELHPFDLDQAVHAACDQFAGVAEYKNVAFEFDIPAEVKGCWRGDGPRLRQVLANLTSNAVKFTNHGKIVIACRACDRGLAFEISDTGVGIPEAHLGGLFQKFSQGDNSMSRRYGGTGLGLAISYQLVDLLGGRLSVQSREGAGTTFRFDLPMSRAADPASAQEPLALYGPPAARADPAATASIRVLVVDDNPTNRRVAAAMLEALGLDVVLAESGPEALAAFMSSAFDLVLMDIQMPGMNGVEAARLMAQHRRAAGQAPIPIVALTANVMTHQVDDYLAAGMCGVIAKPIELAKLVAAIEEVMSARPVAA